MSQFVEYVVIGVYVGVTVGIVTILPAGFALGVLWIQLTKRNR